MTVNDNDITHSLAGDKKISQGRLIMRYLQTWMQEFNFVIAFDWFI